MVRDVDIVVPVFNRTSLLDRALQSVFAQKYKKYQLWVVDDGSTENLKQFHGILQKWRNRFPKGVMRIISLPVNHGVSRARNVGILAGNAPWVAFLDSDDEWLEDKLLTQIRWASQFPCHQLIHSNEVWVKNASLGTTGINAIKSGTLVNQKKKHKKKGGFIFSYCLPLCRISPSAALVKRSILLKAGLFREDFPVCEDYELWLRLCLKTEVGFIEKPLVIKHGGHTDQLSRKYKAMDEWRVRALFSHIDNPQINSHDKAQLLCILIQKCNILLRGYQKHHNFKHETEISTIYQTALKTLSTNADYLSMTLIPKDFV